MWLSSWASTPSSSTRFIFSSSPVVTAIAACLRVATGRERVGRGVVDDVQPRLREPARDAQPFDEVVVAGRTACGSAGLAWLIASATLSLLKYETTDERDHDHGHDHEADEPAAEQVVDGDARRARPAAHEADDEERVFAACSRRSVRTRNRDGQQSGRLRTGRCGTSRRALFGLEVLALVEVEHAGDDVRREASAILLLYFSTLSL